MNIPLLRAKEPADPLKYEKAKKIFNYPARNTLLWVLHCLYVDAGMSPVEHLATLHRGRKGYFHVKEKEHLKNIRHFGLKELENFDVLVLSKIIECTLEGIMKEDDSKKKTMSDIKVKIDKIKDYRHQFAHDRKEVVNLSSSELDNLIVDFMEDVDFLIRKSGEQGCKTVDEIKLELDRRVEDILSQWDFDDDSTNNDEEEENTDETMETDAEFDPTNSVLNTIQGNDHRFLSDASVSNHSVDNKFADKSQDVVMEEEGKESEILGTFSTKTIHNNFLEKTD